MTRDTTCVVEKGSVLLIFGSIFQELEDMFVRKYANSPVKRKSFCELQIFLLISGGHIGAPKRYTNVVSRYKALQRCGKLFGKKTQQLWATKDLRLGFFHLMVFNLFFWLLDSENDLFKNKDNQILFVVCVCFLF